MVQRSSIAIARSVLAQFLTLGQGRVGSYALSKDMRDLFHLAIKGYMDRIEETLNRYAVDRLFSLNEFQTLTAVPRLRHGRMGQRAVDIFVAALEKLFTMGMPITYEDWNFIRTELELPLLPDEEAVPESEQLASTAQQDEDETSQERTARERWYSE